jgi:phage tail sheath protein FI
MAFNIGINVVEVDGRAAPTIVAAPISVAAFLVRSQRGVPNLPVYMRGLSDFIVNFGGVIDGAFGAHAMRGFIDNGGTEAYAVRIVGNNARAASVMLNDGLGTATLEVVAGVQGRPDPGVWGNNLTVTIVDHPRGTSAFPAQIISANVEPFALVNGQVLQVTVNGGTTPVSITFDAANFPNIGAASADAVAAVINRQTTVLRAGVTPSRQLLLSSATPGPTSRLQVAGTAAPVLGFTGTTANSDSALNVGTTLAALQSTGGFLPGSAVRLETRGHIIATNAIAASITDQARIDVTVDGGATPVPIVFRASDFANGVAAITPAEVVAAINRQAQGFSAALTATNRLILLSNRYGLGASIAVAAPPGPPDASTALGFAVGDVPVAGGRQFRELSLVAETYKFVAWTGGLSGLLPANVTRIQSVEFDLMVSRGGVEVERFESVSMQNTLDYYVETALKDEDRGSRFITVNDQNSASGVGQDAPALGPFRLGTTTAGSDGNTPADIDYIGDPAQRTGLYAFDTVRIQLLACPETTAPGVVAAALTYCENHGDAMFVGTAPPGLDLAGIKTYASAFRGRKVFGALYAPWIQVVNPLDTTGTNPRLSIPPVGHVVGMYARIAEARGVWKAPAGDEALLRNALAVEFDMTDTDHTDLVKNGGVNGIRAIPGSGIIVDASRTLSTDTRWLFVNVRRLFNFIKVSLRDGLRFVAQEPHDEALRRMVKFNVVTPFLLGLWRQGAFGSDPPDKVFTVICDTTNNPPAQVNLGNFTIEVYFYPVKPAETIIIIVGQQDSGAATTEA